MHTGRKSWTRNNYNGNLHNQYRYPLSGLPRGKTSSQVWSLFSSRCFTSKIPLIVKYIACQSTSNLENLSPMYVDVLLQDRKKLLRLPGQLWSRGAEISTFAEFYTKVLHVTHVKALSMIFSILNNFSNNDPVQVIRLTLFLDKTNARHWRGHQHSL